MLCSRCLLKQDHHCFFARNCVGYLNMRHFIVMIFWSFISSVIGFAHALAFLSIEVIPNSGYVDALPFVAFVRWLFGYSHFRVGVMVLVVWFLVFFVVLTASMLSEGCKWILKGKTSYELDNGIAIYDCRNYRDKLRAVFGDYWLLNFLFPMHWKFHPDEDPVNWPTINQ